MTKSPPGCDFTKMLNLQKELIKENIAFCRKTRMALELLRNPPEVDVGTTPAEVVYEEDNMKLLHYRPISKTIQPIPLLIVYAVINRPYILDLQPDRSVVRRYLEQGIDVYLIDWGVPGEEDKFTSMNDYINVYINRVVDWLREKHRLEKISLMGYCIGGYFTAVYASIYPEKIENLILMAAPIDFNTKSGLLHIWTDKKYFDVDKYVEAQGNACAWFMNIGFLLLQPVENMHLKYLNFVRNIDNPEFVKNFLRMEKWILYDSIPVAAQFYKEFIKMGYQENLFMRNLLWLGGKHADPKRINMPLLIIVGEKDGLVPPETTTSLKNVVSSKEKVILSHPSGHIGLSVGATAHKLLWPKVVGWLKKRSSFD